MIPNRHYKNGFFLANLSRWNQCISVKRGTYKSPIALLSNARELRVYNSLSEEYEAIPRESAVEPHILKWYACGPTVYDRAHLGHARAYVSQDILRRILSKKFQYHVFLVMGITDVDDKIIRRAKESNIHFSTLAKEQEYLFFKDLDALNVMRPTIITRVSDYLKEIIKYIEVLFEKGYAYIASDGSGVYFDTQKLGPAYGRLDPAIMNKYKISQDTSREEVIDNNSGVESEGCDVKQDPKDFALWKLHHHDEEASWPSPWGNGRPGWHIECSAMSHAVIGPKLDLHSGGIDLKFPHHNNEIAQCEAHNIESKDPWCRHFIHYGHLHIKGLKMSKSLKNFISIEDFFNDGGSADEFRVFCLQYHYRQALHYSSDRLRDARSVLSKLENFFQLIESRVFQSTSTRSTSLLSEERHLLSELNQTQISVEESLMNDFNTPEALSLILKLISSTNEFVSNSHSVIPESYVIRAIASYILDTIELFGITDLHRTYRHIVHPSSSIKKVEAKESEDFDKLLNSLIQFRSEVRQIALDLQKQGTPTTLLDLCDTLRNKTLPSLGLQVDDLSESSFVRPSHSTYIEASLSQFHAKGQVKDKSQVIEHLKLKREAFETQMQVAPEEYFQSYLSPDIYTKFGPDGLPTHDSLEQELTKTHIKKLRKKLEKHKKAYDKYWSSRTNTT